jgi:predicted nuclease with TOPRIM domain
MESNLEAANKRIAELEVELARAEEDRDRCSDFLHQTLIKYAKESPKWQEILRNYPMPDEKQWREMWRGYKVQDKIDLDKYIDKLK